MKRVWTATFRSWREYGLHLLGHGEKQCMYAWKCRKHADVSVRNLCNWKVCCCFCFEFVLLQTCASDKNVFLVFWRAVFFVVSGFWQTMMKWFVTGRSEPKKAIMHPSVLTSFNCQSSLVPSMATAWAFMMVRTELLFWLLNVFHYFGLFSCFY